MGERSFCGTFRSLFVVVVVVVVIEKRRYKFKRFFFCLAGVGEKGVLERSLSLGFVPSFSHSKFFFAQKNKNTVVFVFSSLLSCVPPT